MEEKERQEKRKRGPKLKVLIDDNSSEYVIIPCFRFIRLLDRREKMVEGPQKEARQRKEKTRTDSNSSSQAHTI